MARFYSGDAFGTGLRLRPYSLFTTIPLFIKRIHETLRKIGEDLKNPEKKEIGRYSEIEFEKSYTPFFFVICYLSVSLRPQQVSQDLDAEFLN